MPQPQWKGWYHNRLARAGLEERLATQKPLILPWKTGSEYYSLGEIEKLKERPGAERNLTGKSLATVPSGEGLSATTLPTTRGHSLKATRAMARDTFKANTRGSQGVNNTHQSSQGTAGGSLPSPLPAPHLHSRGPGGLAASLVQTAQQEPQNNTFCCSLHCK